MPSMSKYVLAFTSCDSTQMILLALYVCQAKQWVRSFVALGGQLQGHQKKYVTPYMHSMVYHVPRMLRLYGNIKKFSGQGVCLIVVVIRCDFVLNYFVGVEKNNDD